MAGKPVPPRLFVLLAQEAYTGVIFRQGPSRWVQLIHWDTLNDVFTAGQWFRGTVYVDRSDVSPDGKLLLYLAAKPRIQHAWTAISKPPYFTALAFWDKMYGGGLFHDNDSAQLLGINSLSEVFPFRTEADKVLIGSETLGGSLWEERLLRAGWQSVQRYSIKMLDKYERMVTPAILRRVMDFYTLQIEYAADVRRICYSLLDETNAHRWTLHVDWAGIDQRRRLVFAKDGKIFVGSVDADFNVTPTQLAVFGIEKPDPQPAPEWAREW